MDVDILMTVGWALWFIFPAYAANGGPVLLWKMRKHPLDGGRVWVDGARLFGDGKTIEGVALGVFVGTASATAQGLLVNEVPVYIYAGFLLSFGAMAGDMVGSFTKRRMQLPEGKPAPLLDQVGFLLGALLFYVAGTRQLLPLEVFVVLVLITPLLHVLTNIGAYLLRLKPVPW